jgi:uncharacterized protein YecE (DUF72 family)
MKNNIHIGCSSFNNGYWKGIFYPGELPRSKWFDYYCEHFDTYELNAPFYKFPTLKGLQSWYRKAPDRFVYSVKAPRIITHFRKFEDCTEILEKFYGVIREGLVEKLRCVLFQLPPGFQYDAQKLELILSSLDPSFMNVIEFRHKSWWRDDVFTALTQNNIAFCSVSYPGLPDELAKTNNIRYVRLHGVPKLFYSEYASGYLQILSNAIKTENAAETYIYFNNTAGTGGIANALEMKDFLKFV